MLLTVQEIVRLSIKSLNFEIAKIGSNFQIDLCKIS